jgi:hypothetical protein
MEDAISDIRPYFELLFFVSGIIVAVIALYATRQISLMKADMKMRSERAAKEKAIEASSEYLTAYIPLDTKFYFACKRKGLSSYDGPIGDFSPESISPELKEAALKRMKFIVTFLDANNKLESIAAAFTTGVADERTGFSIIGRTFCAGVADDYDIISLCRIEHPFPYWANIVKLYKTWSSRLSKEELAAARDALESRMKDIPDSHISPIGSENI